MEVWDRDGYLIISDEEIETKDKREKITGDIIKDGKRKGPRNEVL